MTKLPNARARRSAAGVPIVNPFTPSALTPTDACLAAVASCVNSLVFPEATELPTVLITSERGMAARGPIAKLASPE